MRHASLFSGIGGFDLAAEWMGWENVFGCEIDPFCQRVLRHHFPSTILYEDIRTLDGKKFRGGVDVLTGGFPCQPFSAAGKRRGKSDDRYLWPEMLRIIKETRPTWIVGENVAGLLSMAQFDCEPPVDSEGCAIGNVGETYDRTGSGILKSILEALEESGYSVQPIVIPACAIGAWHRRDRIWIIAHDNEVRYMEGQGKINAGKNREQALSSSFGGDKPTDTNDREKRDEGFQFQAIPKLRGVQSGEDERIYADIEGRPDLSTPILCGGYDGIPDGMDRVAAYGNAIVPQVAYEIFQSIQHG